MITMDNARRFLLIVTLHFLLSPSLIAQNDDHYPNSIKPVGIIKGLSDSALLDVVQRQTFRYFWHFGHPVSGLARERSNTIRAENFWDYADEAYGNVNLSTNTYGPETCAIGGTGFGVMATIVAVER